MHFELRVVARYEYDASPGCPFHDDDFVFTGIFFCWVDYAGRNFWVGAVFSLCFVSLSSFPEAQLLLHLSLRCFGSGIYHSASNFFLVYCLQALFFSLFLFRTTCDWLSFTGAAFVSFLTA